MLCASTFGDESPFGPLSFGDFSPLNFGVLETSLFVLEPNGKRIEGDPWTFSLLELGLCCCCCCGCVCWWPSTCKFVCDPPSVFDSVTWFVSIYINIYHEN